MWLKRWRRSWAGLPKVSRSTIDPRRALLGLEQLEDRLAPAQLTVTSALDPATLTAGTLRSAVTQANTDAAHGISDTIVFNTAQMGSSTVTLQQGQLELTAGSGTTTIGGTTTGTGGPVTLSGNNASRLLLADSGATAVLTGLTLQGGNAGTGVGGGIDNNGTLTVSSSTITNNSAASGAGIFNQGTLTLTNDTFANANVANNTNQMGALVSSFTVSAPTTATAGYSVPVTVTAKDAFGNTVTDYCGPVTLTSSDGQTVIVPPGALTWTNGSTTIAATLDKADTLTLTAAVGSVQGTSSALTVSPAVANSFVVTAPSTVSAGVPFTVSLTAQDSYGNTVTGYAGPVTWTSDGQLVNGVPASYTWVNGTTSANVTLSNPNASLTLTATAGSVSRTSSSIAVEATASSAISTGLAGLVSWGASQSFPLIGTASGIQTLLQSLVNPIDSYLANPQNTPTGQAFLTFLESLSSIGVQSVTSSSNGNVTTYSLNFQATQTQATLLKSLTDQADQLGIKLPASTTVNVTTSVNFNFSFGIDQTSSPGTFVLNVPAGGLQASVAINATNINSGIDIGFLGAQVTGGQIQMNAQITNGAAISTPSALQNLTLATTGSLNIALPVQAQLNAAVANQSTSGTVTISAANLSSWNPLTGSWTAGSSPSLPQIQLQGLGNWQYFTNVSSDAVLGMLNQLGIQLGQIGTQLWTTDLPFLGNLTLAQAANLEQAFQTQVLGQISSWNNTLEQTVTNFTTAQDLANLLAQVLNVPLSQINVQFNPTTNVLTYTLAFTTSTFSDLLSNDLQVNLNQGGLSNASITGSQLSLAPSVTANLTFGVNLNPVGQGFVLTIPTPSNPSASPTPLSSLNGGAGVRINGTSPDLLITLTDGSTYQVSLKGAQNIQDVIDDIQTQCAGKVTVIIDPTTQQGLDVVQASSVQGTGTFSIADINGSYAGADLGILGSDEVASLGTVSGQGPAGTGFSALSATTIVGQSLSGDSLAKHFFIQNASFTASVVGTANQVNATADLGAVGLTLNGSGSIQAQAAMSIANATLAQLTSGINGSTALSSLVSTQVSGTANLNLPLQLAVPLAGYTLPTGAEVIVAWPDIANPSTLTVTVTPELNLGTLTMQPVLQGLQKLEDFLQNVGQKIQDGSLQGLQIPGLNFNLGSFVNPALELNLALGNLTLNPPTTIGDLEIQLGSLLGQPISFINGILQLNLNYNFQTTQNVPLDFNLSSSLGNLADINGSDPISLSINGSAQLGVDIDLNQPANPQFYLQDSSNIQIEAQINSTGVAFNANVGPLGVYINGGTVQLGGNLQSSTPTSNGTVTEPPRLTPPPGSPLTPATWTLSLNPNSSNHLWSLDNAGSEVTSNIAGQVSIVLPTFL